MNKKLLSIQVYEKIKEGIISLKYLPGSVLKERELAKSMNVSRTPVREAIQRLSQEFWTISGDSKGVQVRAVSINDINEIRQIRNIVELAAVQFAVENGETRVLAGHLDMILNEMVGINDQYSFTKLDINFHSLVVNSMHNDRLSRFWNTIQEEVLRMGLMTLRGNNRSNEVIDEHKQLVDALWNKNSDKIHTAIKEHINNSYEALLSRFTLKNE